MGTEGTVETQTAYVPETLLELDLKNPEDLFYDDLTGVLYICDTGHSRIVMVAPDGSVTEYTDDILDKPTGIMITDENIYIAEYGRKELLVYTKDFQLLNRIGKPTEPIFGANTKFAPRKLVVDSRGELYVVSEGSTSGLMQFNPHGNFLGYFGANTSTTSLKMILQRTFFTEEQLEKLFKITPASVVNVAMDKQGLIYTVTGGAGNDMPLKKLSVSGLDLFGGTLNNYEAMVDADVDPNGNTFAVDMGGTIFEYDSNGNLLFAFGGTDTERLRLGILVNPVAIDVTNDERIFVLDKKQNGVVVYKATEFASLVHEGIAMYNDGLYEQSEDIWERVRKMNTGFVMAYEALAKSSYKKQDYDQALDFYAVAGNNGGYAQAFWVARNNWLQNNLTTAIVICFVLFLLYKLIMWLDGEKDILDPLRKLRDNFLKIPLVQQVLFAKMVLKKPVDAYYDIRRKRKATVASATILYLWYIVLQITDIYVVGLLFNTHDLNHVNLLEVLVGAIGPVALFILCNYLVSSITEGEGKASDLYIGLAYCMTPYLIAALPLQIITNVLVQNESFVYHFPMLLVLGWSVILFFMMVQEMHNYTFKQTVKNLLITLCTIFLFLLIGFIIYLLFGQLRDFVVSIVQEVAIRG
jgi:sugar lactone lactonase YvrE